MSNCSALVMRVMRYFMTANGEKVEFKINIQRESTSEGVVRRRLLSGIKRLERRIESWKNVVGVRRYKSEARRETALHRLKVLRAQLRVQEDKFVFVSVNTCDGNVYRELGASCASDG